MGRLLDEDAVIDVLRMGEELLKRILYEMDVVGQAREKYSWGLRLIESYIRDIGELPSAEPDKDMIHLQKEQAYMQGYEDGRKSRKGKWNRDGEIPNTCSICGEDWDKYVEGQEIWYTGEIPNFCPHCGSYNGGEEE